MDSDEAPRVFETPGGLSVSYGGRLLYSARRPAEAPRRAALSCDPGPERLHLVASPLLWYGLPELLSRMGRGSAVLCVETDPLLAEIALRAAPPGLIDGSRVAFLRSDSPEAVAAAALALGRFRACSLLPLSGGEAAASRLYRAMADLVCAQIEAGWRNRASLMAMGRLWARNVLDNVSSLAEILPQPLPAFPGPVALCGAGPSLEAALPLLARRSPTTAVVACDTALGTLLAAGIRPDLGVCLEAQAHNLPDFTPLGDRELPLIADLSSHPATFRAVRGPKHLSAVRIAESPFLARARAALEDSRLTFLAMPPLGSVGVHAARIARAISAGPVLAFGLDFSFEAGKTHARGSPALAAEERRLGRLTRWSSQYAASFRPSARPAPCPPLADGRRLISDQLLSSYARLLAEEAGAPGPALLDARGRGLDIGAAPIGAAEAERILCGPADQVSASPLASEAERGAQGSRAAAARAARAFLEGEAARLDELYDIMKGRAAAGPERVAAAVAEADYLYWCFPDAERAGALAQDFLNRLLPELEWWSARISSSLDALRL